jgi:hypothetical protein
VVVVAGFFLGLSWGPADPMMSTLVQSGAVEQFGLPTAYLALATLLALFSVAALLSSIVKPGR